MSTDFIYLASASPRRAELLAQIAVPFRVRVADVDESVRPGEAPRDYVARLAAAKAEAVWRGLGDDARPVLAADTAVVAGGRILGKPSGLDEALEMLAALSGRSHEVLSAVALRTADGLVAGIGTSEVRFRATTQAERLAYCRSEEPWDKAGGYAIQGRGAVFVERLEGSYSTVMGLPLYETAQLLARVGQPGWLAD